MSTTLPRLRKRIDKIDRQLLSLLNRRARLALAIGDLKKSQGLPVLDNRREGDVLRRVARANAGPLSPAALAAIFKEILRRNRRIQR